ncbi:MAG: histidine phosphatase family protein [Candidatus Dojkabacteria bacterium]|nr:MAG: histidine phosphatase family protein [Candidatus Dojkabacteria bacterium]
MKTLYFIRHPQTVWNVEDRLQGTLDSPVTDYGKETSRAFVQNFRPKQRVDAIYYAFNGRTEFLADLLYKKLSKQYPLEIIQDERMNERSFGKFEGWTVPQMEKVHKYNPHSPYEKYSYKIETIESYEETLPRVKSFLDDFKSSTYQNGICVTSGAIVRLALLASGQKNIEEIFSFKAPNLGIYEVIV